MGWIIAHLERAVQALVHFNLLHLHLGICYLYRPLYRLGGFILLYALRVLSLCTMLYLL